MSSFTQLNYHLVFGTKYRHHWIKNDIEEELYEYIGGIIRNLNGSLIEIGGVADHIHILARLSPALAVSDAIRKIKSGSSKWVSDLGGEYSQFSWQKGYSAFTVSYSHRELVKTYIMNQKEHHRQKSFAEEYIDFLKKHGIEFRMEWLFEDEHHG